MVTELLLVPLAPSPIEVDRLGANLTLAAEAEDLGATLDIRLLLTRVRLGTRSAGAIRRALADLGLPVLDREVRLLERYAQAHGKPAPDGDDDCGEVLFELFKADVRI